MSATSAFTWDGAGNLLTVDGPLAGTADTTRYRYGAGHQVIGVVGPDPDGSGALLNRAVRYTYDARGLLISVEKGTLASQSDADWANFSPIVQVTSTYDTGGQKATDSFIQYAAVQRLAQYSYNSSGLLQCTAVRDPAYAASLPVSACSLTASTAAGADRITQIGYDAAGETTTVTEGAGTSDAAVTSTLAYGGDGEQATAKDANGNLTTFLYDGFNRRSTIEFPDPSNIGVSQTGTNGIETYAYDAASNVTTLTRRGTTYINYTYDNLNRRTAANQASSSSYASYTYGYDNFSHLTATASSQGYSHSFTYDALGRMTAEGSPFGTVTSTYDAAGNRTQLIWPDGFGVSYTYDLTGAMTAVQEYGATSGVGLLATITYDNLGRRVSLARGDGALTSYGYNAAAYLSSIAHSFPNSAQNQTETYTYTVGGQLGTKTSSNDGWAWNGGYNFDKAFGVNGLNEQTSAGSATLSWAAKGVLTGDGTLTYSTDSNDKMYSVSNGSAQMYDGDGRIYSVGASAATRFAYDGDLAIAEYNTSGTIMRRFVPGQGEDEPLVWYEGSGTTTRYGLEADRLGSVTGITNDSGTVVGVNSYDEYGVPGTGNSGRYQYTGQKYMSEFGMYDYKARNYYPTLGRFIQPDPIGYGDGMNIYSYGNDDPVNNTDPTGLASYSCPSSTPDDIVVCAPIENTTFGTGALNSGLSFQDPVMRIIRYVFSVTNKATATPQGDTRCSAGGPAGLLTNLAGAFFALQAYVAGKADGTNPQVQVAPNGVRVTNSPINFGQRAVTLGNFEIFTPSQTPKGFQQSYTGAVVNNGRHEDGHTYQASALGDLFLPLEALLSPLGDNNPLEVDADRHALNGHCP